MVYVKGMDLSKYLERYPYFPKFTEFVFGEVAQAIRDQGYLDKEDLALIYVWKSILFQIHKRFESYGVEDDEEKIRNVTKQIFEIDHLNRNDISNLLDGLDTLRGVGIKVASAILSVVFPDRYGVFDKHVKKALKIEEEDKNACIEAIFKMREIAVEQERMSGKHWTPRMVDMALWELHIHGDP